jgi:phosphoenolpyruvate carboxylase
MAVIPPEKDLPLREDIRLLGRILGDTLRALEGSDSFNLIESVRSLSIRCHRDDDPAARIELQELLRALSSAQASQVVRAFSYFSQLANIAEDQHHIRRSRAHAVAGSAPREGTIAHSVQRALEMGVDARRLLGFFDGATVSPVLTAHPTEVQRKSILDCHGQIAALLAERDRSHLTPEEQAAQEEAIRRAVMTLWQTRMLRPVKLSVMDEVGNALSFYDTTFLRALPRLYNAAEDDQGLERETRGARNGVASAHVPGLGLLSHPVVEHGHGARQDRPGHRRVLCPAGGRRNPAPDHFREAEAGVV